MELLQLALLMLGGVLISSLLEPMLPRVSLPLVQILIGIVFALFVPLSEEVNLDSDLFLVLFIAPLLFDESKNADNRALWQNKGSILSMAIGLVVVAVFVIGFALHAIVASVPLAAAFAVGAALGPTDAVAVASLGKDVALSKRQKAQLSGEALLNDASGVVSFEFAILAATTGMFSIADAGKTFAIDFLGGIALGLVLGIVYLFVSERIRRAGLDTVTIHVLFEICLPFFIYLSAETLHVSGILAVVAAGLLITFRPLTGQQAPSVSKTPSATRLELVSDSVWEVLTFVLNGVIFILLGILLPQLTEPILSGVDVTSLHFAWLVGIVLVITAVMHALRYLWIVAMDFISSNEETGGRAKLGSDIFKNALVTTLAGAKGAVAIAIAFTIPMYLQDGSAFPHRNLLIFIVCGVCVFSLLLANFVVPVLAPRDEDEQDEENDEVEIEILSNVIDQLRDKKNSDNAQAVGAVVRSYQHRIASIRKKNASSAKMRALRLEILGKQEDYIRDAMLSDSIDKRVAEDYLKRIDRFGRRLKRASKEQLKDTQALKPLASSTTAFGRVAQNITPDRHVRSTIEFKIDVEVIAVHHLEGASRSKDAARADAAKALLAEHRPLLSALRQRKRSIDEAEGIVDAAASPSSSTVIKRTKGGKLKKVRPSTKPKTLVADMHAEALRLELEQIQVMRRKGKLSNAKARELRDDVYLVQMGLADS